MNHPTMARDGLNYVNLKRAEALARFDFNAARQQEFARLSGDWNPIHIDPAHARRTQAGSLAVHGIHVVCRCLEAVAEANVVLPPVRRLTARFGKPTLVGDNAAVSLVERTESRFRLRATVGDLVTMELTLDRNAGSADPHAVPVDLVQSDPRVPRVRSFREIAEAKGNVDLAVSLEEVCSHFPAACLWIGVSRVSALLCISRIVGMECPGLYSLLGGLDLELGEISSNSGISYVVAKANERLRTVRLAVEGLGVRGIVDGFVRHPPVHQLSFSEVAAQVGANEFEGQSALIVGGSRGLGELTSKIIAAGGGHPILTYCVGQEEAERIHTEITGAGGRCGVLRYDVRLPAKMQIEQLPSKTEFLYYYATSPIFRRKSEVCDPALLNEFLQFYVFGFQDLCFALMPLVLGRLSVFNPSSIALGDRPRGITEYAMAKAASEVLSEDLMRQFTGLKIVHSRLPRLLTDQTSSFVPAKLPNTLDVLLPIIRQVQSRAAQPETVNCSR